MFAKAVLSVLEDRLVLGQLVYRDLEAEYAKGGHNGFEIGNTIKMKKPAKYQAVSGATISSYQDHTEDEVSMVVNEQWHVPIQFSSIEATLDLPYEKWQERVVVPAAVPLANKIDEKIAALYVNLHEAVGTPATSPSSFEDMQAIDTRMEQILAPPEKRCAVYNVTDAASLVAGLKGHFVPDLNKGWLQRNQIGSPIGALTNYRSNNLVISHTGGAGGGTPLIDGASQTGASLNTKGWPNSTAVLKAGDIITIADVNAVHDVSKVSYGRVKQFVVTADVTSDGSGDAVVAISPSITTSGAFQTVDAGPADAAAITIASGTGANAHAANLAFSTQTFGLAVVPLVKPRGATYCVRMTSKQGLSIRIINDYDVTNDKDRMRMDILFGVKTLYPETGVRVFGKGY
jgi:hypothetical protein